MSGVQLVVVMLSAVGGLAAGWGARQLLARLRRGVTLAPGPLELGTAAVVASSVAIGWARPTLALILLAGWLLVLLTPVDLVHHRLPDAVTLPALPVAAVTVAVTYLLSHPSGSVNRAVLVAAVLWALFAATARIRPAAMGRGDVKLIPTIGLLTGYVSLGAAVVALALACVLGALASIVGMLAGRLELKSSIAFGPFLLVGGWAALLIA
ncbi:leader peptidase (prepilin peptidase) / N-methyltransferase [Nakamurella panacisegetis]|uniref:Leader peptidase (Prepilin peptidase) / N-methyltransferase n=1 Tax=Nakamurella panacisegetis TaxID=1090615 RepID=A0A1H0QY24_9ACTN|nr:A24 family peptidase [Nakamurella panacisegetis]SDP22192.1 leader peptidase (prepilin peptidase) / N-methyltransferase [Nakamurella panacisegetis]